MATPTIFEQMKTYVYDLQDRIVAALEAVDDGAPSFKRDAWTRPQGGAGRSCVFAASDTSHVLEKAGVGVSVIHGALPPAAVRQMRADHASIPLDPNNTAALPFHVAGISLIVHPRNPSAATVHMNVRYFEILKPRAEDEGEDAEQEVLAWWFGGGSDLTPSYLFDEDAEHFHKTFKVACDAHGADLYPAFKTWCDEYFYIPHRSEARGVGGIFFDDLTSEPHKRLPGDAENTSPRPRSAAELLAFTQAVGDALLPAYIPLLERRAHAPSTEEMRRWQLLRRGRYVEFNLVHDRGTKFGLMTPGARIESILMSLPETARWEYMSEMGEEEGSEEARLLAVLRKPRDWA